MPQALRICSAPNCSKLIGNGRKCPVHGKRAWDGRPSAAARGYDHAWRVLRLQILERDGHVCGYCGRPATTVDHRTPKAQGGTDDPANLIACCTWCQRRKAGREGATGRRIA